MSQNSHVDNAYTYVKSENLHKIVSQIFIQLGIPEDDAVKAATVLVTADLRGVESHGVSIYMEVTYVPGLKSKLINPTPNIKIIRESPSTALVDGDKGLGMVVGQWAMKLAIKKAKKYGTAFVTVANSRHFGMAGYYSMMALSEDMIGLSMTNATPHVLPTFGSEPRMGTNPISLAVPANKESPFVLDMATSTVAVGKILIANRLGLPIPYGWAADLNGEITTDPNIAKESKKLMPLGGTKELGGHKGYGLATMVDILCGVLSGSVISSNIVRNGPVGHFFGAFNIESFRDPKEFKDDMDYLLHSLKSTPTIEGEDRVYYAGLIEEEVYQERLITGIPLANKVIETLRKFAIELDVHPTI